MDLESAFVAECLHANVALDTLLSSCGTNKRSGKLFWEWIAIPLLLHVNRTSSAPGLIIAFSNVIIPFHLFVLSGEVESAVKLHWIVWLLVFLHVRRHTMHAWEREHGEVA